jgi:hypothetical protein
MSLYRGGGKFEIRISKSETNSKSERRKIDTGLGLFVFAFSDFGFVSNFGFRYSDFLTGGAGKRA